MNTIQQKALSAEVEVALSAHDTHPVDVYSWLKSLTEMQRLMTEESEAVNVINGLRAGLIHWIQETAEQEKQSSQSSHKTSNRLKVIATDGNVVSLKDPKAWQRQVK